MSVFIGVDPGVNGAFAIVEGVNVLKLDELPRFEKRVNAAAFAEIISTYEIDHAVIELVHAMPKQGVASTFTFGAAFGAVVGVVAGAGIPYSLVPATKWKTFFKLNGKPKDFSREVACGFYPRAATQMRLKRHHGRADALLLARYGLSTIQIAEAPELV